MALGICAICTEIQAKYKCPKCSVAYCSLPCFKNEKHSHTAPPQSETADPGMQDTAEPQISPESSTAGQASTEENSSKNALFEKIASDSVIQSLLLYKSLQVHLSILLRILLDSLLTREPIFENRKEIVNMRLCDLRIGGAEENELIEEFVQRVLYLTEAGAGEV